jgi:septal ring factor EnvC (AmiA/AmiB activator)
MKTFPGHRTLFRFVLPLLLVTLSAWPAGADDLAKQRQSLKEIQGRIERLSKQLKNSREAEGEVEQELNNLEKELHRLQQNSRRLQHRLTDIKKDIAEKEKRADAVKIQISEREKQVRRRLRALYRRGEMRLFKVLFEQSSPSQIAENFLYLTRLVRQDRLLIGQFRDDWRVLKGTLDELEHLRSEREKRLEILEASQKTLDKGRQTRQAALGDLRENRKTIKGEIARLQEKAKRLRQLLKTLESEKPREYSGEPGAFGKKKGTLPWPGSGELVVRFGSNFHEELGTRYESQGIELAGPAGSPISAVAAGKVVFAKPFRGFGNLLILDHGDGYYTLYAQARELLKKPGETVAAGDRVGVSGFGGNKTIYFEIRQRGTPLDPLRWLRPRP